MSKLAPILKWPGGKRWLVRALAEWIGLSANSHIVEPFVGGGALFFDIRPKAAILGDINVDLIACYRAIRNTPAVVNDVLRELTIDRQTYANVAAAKPIADIDRAVRLIYLNRTAFGGIWRVNQMESSMFPLVVSLRQGFRIRKHSADLRCSPGCLLVPGDFVQVWIPQWIRM